MKKGRGVQRIVPEIESPAIDGSELLSMDNDSLSLEDLSKAYAKLLEEESSQSALSTKIAGSQKSSDPSSHLNDGTDSHESDSDFADSPATIDLIDEAENDDLGLEEESPLESTRTNSDDHCPVTATTIFEAMLFVGRPDNRPITAEEAAAKMRGVTAQDVDGIVEEINARYSQNQNAMHIVAVDSGYQMQIRNEVTTVRDSMYGKIRETRLNQAAIDCLALVAYNPGATRQEIENLWNRPAGSILGLLVRKDLIELKREGQGKSAISRYFPTDRMLNLIGLESLDDLPRVESDF